jgi:hypothetical protein
MQQRLLLAGRDRHAPGASHTDKWVPQYPREPSQPRTTVDQLGRQIQWVHSYVTRDRVYYVYQVPNEPFEPMPVE